jgi:hypothetical protein
VVEFPIWLISDSLALDVHEFFARQHGSVVSGRTEFNWISPIARALLKAHEGDVVELRTPTGIEQIEVIEIRDGDG